ncbi:MAG: dTDP-4-dehydrorhamnose reductase [Bacteroidia bacterium]|nr:MAG: dTDP-4-dehydrorhamnose reductase [Bacteroidia bacterium]
MNILITGSNGQLGKELQQQAVKSPKNNYIFTDIDTLDITSFEAIQQFIQGKNIDFIINCAAYTNVDNAEDDTATANLLNGTAAGYLAQVADENNITLLHISTDYVFSGTAKQPYNETDTPAPNTAYGKSKLKGEQLVQKYCKRHIIVRTAWLYSPFGKNFLKNMIALGQQKNELGVVADQIGTPTYAFDLASCLLKMVEIIAKKEDENLYGIYHFTNEGICSWFDFAERIQEIAQNNCIVKPLKSHEFKTKAPRPYYSVLNKSKIKRTFGFEIPEWSDRVEHCIKRLKK